MLVVVVTLVVSPVAEHAVIVVHTVVVQVVELPIVYALRGTSRCFYRATFRRFGFWGLLIVGRWFRWVIRPWGWIWIVVIVR